MATFATRLKEMRLANNLSQKKLAENIGVTSQTISLWERGPRKPDDNKISALCFELSVCREYLLGITDEYAPDIPPITDEQKDRLAAMEDDEDLWKMAVRMCQLSYEMREMVKATIRQAYRLDKQNDRLIPFDQHKVSIISTELLDQDNQSKEQEVQPPEPGEDGA